MVFKMSSQPVSCKRGRSQVRLNNNTLFYFPQEMWQKLHGCISLKASILLHSLSPSMRAKSIFFKRTIGKYI